MTGCLFVEDDSVVWANKCVVPVCMGPRRPRMPWTAARPINLCIQRPPYGPRSNVKENLISKSHMRALLI